MKTLMIDALGVLSLAMYDFGLCENLGILNGGNVVLEVPEGYGYSSSQFTIRRGSRHMEKELGKLFRILEYVKWLKGVATRALEWQPDIIHWQFGFFSFFDLLITRRLKATLPRARVVITLHDARPGKPTFNNLFARKSFFRSADGVVVHSPEAGNDFQEWLGAASQMSAVRIIPHGPFVAGRGQGLSKEEIRRHFNLEPQGLVITSIGSINENKDLSGCIELITELQKLSHSLNFLIGGSSGDADLSAILEQKNKAPAPERITILDRYLTDDEVDQAHRIADFSLLIYRVSTTSGAAVHSLCAGVPVICNDRPGFRAVVTDGWNGFMVDECNPAVEALRICQVLQNPETLKAMKENARSSYQGITWDHVAREHCKFYRELLWSHA